MKYYIIVVTDTEQTFNINCHSYECSAASEAEAIGKMITDRPMFRSREILFIKSY